MKKYNRLKANTPAHNWWESFDTEQQCLIWDKIFNIRQKYDYTFIYIQNEGIAPEFGKKYSIPQKERDVLCSILITKFASIADLESPWLTMQQVINFIHSKDHSFENLSRDTINRKIDLLCQSGEIKKTKAKSLTEEELKKISHNRTFKYVYKSSSEALQVYKSGFTTAARVAPLEEFINDMIDVINLMPDEKKEKILKRIN